MSINVFRTTAGLSALLVTAALAGCSSDTSPAPESGQHGSHHGSYAGCLAEHGVPTPPPGPGGPPPGVDKATWDEAVQACASLAPGPR
jgi:hypothetical protein